MANKIKLRSILKSSGTTPEDRELLYYSDSRELVRGIAGGNSTEKLNGWELVNVTSLPTTLSSLLSWVFYRVTVSSASYITLPPTTYLSAGWCTRIENKAASNYTLRVDKYGGGWSQYILIGRTFEFMWDGTNWNVYDLTLDNSYLEYHGTTTNAVQTELFINGIANSRLAVPMSSNVSYRFHIIATTTSGIQVFELWARASRAASPSSTAVTVGVLTPKFSSQPVVTATVTANTTLGTIDVKVTGEAGTVKWKVILAEQVILT